MGLFGRIEKGGRRDAAAGVGTAEGVHELVERIIAHDGPQLGENKHPFSRRNVVPGVRAKVSVDLGQGKILPAAAGDGRQVMRRRREEGKRQSLTVANTKLAAGGAGPDGLLTGDDPLIIGERRRQPEVSVRRRQNRTVPGRRIDAFGFVVARHINSGQVERLDPRRGIGDRWIGAQR